MKAFNPRQLKAMIRKNNIDPLHTTIVVCENKEEYEAFQDQNSWTCRTFQNGEVETIILETNDYKIIKSTDNDNQKGHWKFIIKGWRD